VRSSAPKETLHRTFKNKIKFDPTEKKNVKKSLNDLWAKRFATEAVAGSL
jgi:hypothetical protein